MTQPPPYPPPPPGYIPPGFSPPGYPPPGNYPPGGYAIPPSTRTSGAAIASLVCGILLCIPFITSLLAFILGLVGISSTKSSGVRGRGLAVAGLILGFLGLTAWLVVTDRGIHLYQRGQPERAFAKTYVADLLAGNFDADVARSTDKITHDSLQALQQQTQPWGTLQNSMIIGFHFKDSNGNYQGFAVGVCQFTSGQHQYQMQIARDSTGALKADAFKWTQ